MTKLEEDLQAVHDDLKAFIDEQKRKLEREKSQMGRNSVQDDIKGRSGFRSPRSKPRQDDYDLQDPSEQRERKSERRRWEGDEEPRGLELGQYERKQQKLKDERAKEYKLYLAEQDLRRTGKVDPSLLSDLSPRRKDVGSKDDRDPFFTKRNQALKTPDKYDAYDEMLRRKRAEEKRYRGGYDDPEINPERDTSYNDDELFEWAREKAKLGRRQSAREERREKDKLPYDDRERSKSVPPATGGAIFGGKDELSSAQKKKEEYKRELEKQIKEKEEQKKREKLKRMGRITSDTDLQQDSFGKQTRQEFTKEASPRKRPQDDHAEERSPRSSRRRQSSRPRFHDDDQPRLREDDRSRFREDDRPRSRDYDEDRFRDRREDRYRPNSREPFYPNTLPYDPYMAMMYGRYDFPNNMRLGQFGMPGPMYGGMGGYGGMGPSSNGATRMRYDVDDKGDERRRYDLRLNGLDSDKSSQRENKRQRTPRSPRKRDSPRKDDSEYEKNGRVIPPGGRATGDVLAGNVVEEDPNSKRAAQQAYQQELQRQIKEKQRAKEKEKSEKERYEARLEAQIATYDPWGKGGAGAPVKDEQGNIVADLRVMRQYNQEGKIISPRQQPRAPALTTDGNDPSPIMAALDGSFNAGQISARSDGDGNLSYARGQALKELQGHGQKEANTQKRAQLQYADFLKQQVEDKKRKELEEKEKQRIEEEKEAKRLADQQARIHREFIEEQEAQRRKEEEARKQNDELRKVAEEKRLEAERKRKEMEEDRQRELRRVSEERRSVEQPTVVRGSSPPIPTVQKTQAMSSSPPLPAVAKQMQVNRTEQISDHQKSQHRQTDLVTEYHQITEQLQSSRLTPSRGETRTRDEITEDVDMKYLNSIREVISKQPPGNSKASGGLNNSQSQQKLVSELTALRHQLQKQEKKIQSELEHNKAKYKELENKSTVKRNHLSNMEIFDKAMQRKSAVPRKKVQKATEEFRHIADNSSTFDIHQQFRNEPTTSSTLDMQQREFIRQQEQKLAELRKAIDDTSRNFMIDVGNQRPATGQRRPSKQSLLDSDSKFISIDDPTEDPVIPPQQQPKSGRKSSARERRRWEQENKQDRLLKPSTPGGYSVGSMTTMAIEQIAAKNEERLKKLQAQSRNRTGDDPENSEDIVDEFMNQRQSRI